MRKVLLPLTLALTAMGTVQGQNEYSTLVVETKSGTTLEVSLQKSPNVFVSNKEFTIVCGDEVTGYVHDEVRKFYFKPYDSKTGIEVPVAANTIRIAWLDESKVIISGISEVGKVRLYTLDGRSVAADTSTSGEVTTISLDGLVPDTYILNIDDKQSFKLLKR